MKKLSSKEIALTVLIAGFLLILYIQFKRGAFSSATPPPDVRAIGKTADAHALPPIPKIQDPDPPQVKIPDKLRNLFNYSKSPEETAEEERQRRQAEAAAVAAQKRQAEEAEAARKRAEAEALARANIPPPPPPPPTINFRFIGKMGSPQTPLAILADQSGGGDVLVVKQGEVIQGQFKVVKIEFDSVTIGYVKPEWTETKTIKMGT